MIGNDPNNYRITAANSFVDVMNAADLASVIFFADGADEKQVQPIIQLHCDTLLTA